MNKAGNVPNLMVPLVVAGFLLLGLALSVAVDPIYGWAVLAVGLFASMSIGRPRLILVICLLWSGVTEFAITLTSSTAIRYTDEMIVLVITGMLIMEHISQRPNYPDLRRIIKMTALLIVVTLISAILNLVPTQRVLHFFLSYLSFIPVFFLAYDTFRPQDYRYIFRSFVAVFLLQFVLNLSWWAGLFPNVDASRSAADFAVGTFGVCNIVAYFSVVVVVSAIAALRTCSGSIRRMSLVVLAVCGLVQLYMTFTVHAYVTLLGALITYYLLIFNELRHRWVPAFCGVFVLCVLLLLSMNGEPASRAGDGAFSVLNWDYLTLRGSTVLEGPKGQTIMRLFRLVPETSPLVPIIGGGPGNFLSSIGIINVVPMAREVMGEYYLTYSGRMDMASGSILQHPVTGYVAIFSELGLIGFLLYVGLYIYAVARITRQLIRREYTQSGQRLLAQIYVVASAVFGMVNVLADFFYVDFFQVSIWLLAACVWSPHREAELVEDADGSPKEKERDDHRQRSLLSRLYGPVSSISPEDLEIPDRSGDGTV